MGPDKADYRETMTFFDLELIYASFKCCLFHVAQDSIILLAHVRQGNQVISICITANLPNLVFVATVYIFSTQI